MVIVNDLGRLLLQQGWSESEVIELGYGQKEEEKPSEEYYQYDEEVAIVTTTAVASQEVSETEPPISVLTEMLTEGYLTDAYADMLTGEVTAADTWEGVTSTESSLTELLVTNVSALVTNATEMLMTTNSSAADLNGYPVFFKKARDYYPMFLPGPLQVSLLLIGASAILLVASKYAYLCLW